MFFNKNIKVARSWGELNEWQLQEIAHLYLNTSVEEFEGAYLKMIFILFQRKKGFWANLRLSWILKEIPITKLSKHSKFLLEQTSLHSFPSISGLVKPADRIGNITSKHYSVCDAFFHQWEEDKSEINLRRFVASLYRLEDKFDELKMPEVSKITDTLSHKERQRIALAYKFVRIYIWEKYPVIFPKPKEKNTEEEKLSPTFGKKEQKYTPFDKVIMGLVYDEDKPLGIKKEANDTRIYEFLNILTESILRYKEKERIHNANK